MSRVGAGVLPPAAGLLSRAFWFACDHPLPVLGLGLLGTAPAAALLLLFLREALLAVFTSGEGVAGLLPLASGLAAVSFLRFPFRLALARFMAAGPGGSVGQSARFALVHLPAALLYGALSTLGWVLGAVLLLPLALAFSATLAFHRFAATGLTAWEALGDAWRVPTVGLALRLGATCGALVVVVFLVLWTSPGAALGLAEWLVRADVAALREALGPGAPAWTAAALVLSLTAGELLWTLAFGLLAADWQRLTEGSDLAAALDLLEARPATAGEAFE